ncbi:MAG: hypothetical protein FK730_08335 [Asgard group archaeon]|nr:hypothetical protein [Asgard group archaeon]
MSFSSQRRATAVKLKIGDIIAGEFVTNQDGSKALHVKTDDIIRRVRIMGEITSKVINEAEEMVIYDVTDKTGVIKVRGGGDEYSGSIYLDMLNFKEGIVVDIIGMVRDFGDGNVYIYCEMCIPVTDPSFQVLRELEISKYYKRKGLSSDATASIETAIKGQVKLAESDEIKNQILDLLKKPENIEEGCTFDHIKRELNLTTRELEPELIALKSDGDIFEPSSGRFQIVRV